MTRTRFASTLFFRKSVGDVYLDFASFNEQLVFCVSGE